MKKDSGMSMIEILVVVVIVAILGSVALSTLVMRRTVEANSKNIVQNGLNLPVREIVIEGCQYLVIESGSPYEKSYSISVTHKGNCKNHGLEK